tara:strand:+ start:286 stop:1290 length:1005 start_codon:yes stop_codon:yes gene_type:complete
MAEEAKIEVDPSTTSENQDEKKSESSSVERETEEDLLAVVEKAMNPPKEAESHSEDEVKDGEQEEQQVETQAETLSEATEKDESPDEAEEEENAKLPFHNHPRFKQVIKERKEAKEQLELARKDQDEYKKITSYLEANNLTADEAAQGFQIMAMMKSSPTEAIKALTPYMNSLQEATGQTLSDDIREKVDQGYMDEDIGKELSMARAENERLKKLNESQSQQQDLAKQRQNIDQLANAVTEWENKIAQTDPDYSRIEKEVNDRVRVKVLEAGRPETQEQALKIAQEAYNEVKGRHVTTKTPIKATQGGKLGGTPMPEPKSLMDVVEMALTGSSS